MNSRIIVAIFLLVLAVFLVSVALLQSATAPVRQVEKVLPDERFPR